MREFVGDYGTELQLGQSTERADGKKNHGTEPTDNRGCIKMQRFAIANGAGDAETVLHFAAECEKRGAHGLGIATAQTRYQKEPARGAQAEEQYADKPEFDESGKKAAGNKTRLSAGCDAMCSEVHGVDDDRN